MCVIAIRFRRCCDSSIYSGSSMLFSAGICMSCVECGHTCIVRDSNRGLGGEGRGGREFSLHARLNRSLFSLPQRCVVSRIRDRRRVVYCMTDDSFAVTGWLYKRQSDLNTQVNALMCGVEWSRVDLNAAYAVNQWQQQMRGQVEFVRPR